MHRSENPIYVFPEMKLRGLVFNSFIHVSGCSQIGRPVLGIYYCSPTFRYMNVEIGRQSIIILFWKQRRRTVSFLGLHKSEPVGFSPALHLQCGEEGGGVGLNGMRRRVGKKKGGRPQVGSYPLSPLFCTG